MATMLRPTQRSQSLGFVPPKEVLEALQFATTGTTTTTTRKVTGGETSEDISSLQLLQPHDGVGLKYAVSEERVEGGSVVSGGFGVMTVGRKSTKSGKSLRGGVLGGMMIEGGVRVLEGVNDVDGADDDGEGW
jgi:hypothetical protein